MGSIARIMTPRILQMIAEELFNILDISISHEYASIQRY